MFLNYFILFFLAYFPDRLERYPQDMGSDEEDGGYDSLYQSEFENFGTVTPRMSMLLDESFRYANYL